MSHSPKQWILQEIQQVYILDASHFEPAAFTEAMLRVGFDIRGAQPSTLYEVSELLERMYSSLPKDYRESKICYNERDKVTGGNDTAKLPERG